MSELITIARPYAKAVFELAQAQGKLAEWSNLLAGLASSIGQADVAALLEDPRLSDAQVGDVLVKAYGDQLDQQGQNFVRLLAENDRLDTLVNIAALYEVERAKAEQLTDVLMVSAQEVTPSQIQALQTKLEAELNGKVRIETQVDESLVGGAVIKYGDRVIDGSVKGRLAQLAGVVA